MKIFVGRISPDLDADTIFNHFKTFGEIEHYNFKGQFAFVEFKNEQDAIKVLNRREIEVNGHIVIVEASTTKGRPRDTYNEPRYNDTYNEPRYNDTYNVSRYNDNYNESRYNEPRRYDHDRRPLYDDYRPSRYPFNYDYSNQEPYPPRYGYNPREEYRQPQRSDREDCSYCSRCEIHGHPRFSRRDNYEPKKPRREHPNDVNKIVIQDLPNNVELSEIDNFVKANGFEFIFSRLTMKRDSAIVELKNIEARDQAISKLNGLELKGSVVHVREFRVSGNFQNTQVNNNRNNDESQGIDIYSGLDK